MINKYDDEFFQRQREMSLRAARIVAPAVLRFIKPNSILDIGCGCGAWLRAFQELGVSRIHGIDGDYLAKKHLLIKDTEFSAMDLANPLTLQSHYDLAICVEVLEHLRGRQGIRLISALAKAAPVILFSAAIPGQGGTHHVNEQWPQYWQKQFSRFGLQPVDAIRPAISGLNEVPYYYRQNLTLYASRATIESSPSLKLAEQIAQQSPLRAVHQDILDQYSSVRGSARALVSTCIRAVKNKFVDFAIRAGEDA